MPIQPSSYLQRLERAKSLFRSGHYDEAQADFESLVSYSKPVSPDVFIGAAYGLGDCLRLAGKFSQAARCFRQVLTVYRWRPSSDGSRLQECNREAALSSLLGLIELGRLSLRVPSERLVEFIQCSMEWAESELQSDFATPAFEMQQLLLERNVTGPRWAARGLQRLIENLKTSRREFYTAADVTIIELRQLEALLDDGSVSKRPEPPPGDHWASGWAQPMYDLQLARRSFLQQRCRQCRSALHRLMQTGLSEHPDLELDAASLWAEVAPNRKRRQAICDFRSAVLEAFRGVSPMGDLSLALFHLCRALILQLTNPRIADSREVEYDFLRLGQYLAMPRLQAVLISRSLISSEISDLRKLCHHSDTEAIHPWTQERIQLLEKLRQCVRP